MFKGAKSCVNPAKSAIRAGLVGQAGGLFSISAVQFKSRSGCALRTLHSHWPSRAPSRPFQIMRHSVHACHEFNPPSLPRADRVSWDVNGAAAEVTCAFDHCSGGHQETGLSLPRFVTAMISQPPPLRVVVPRVTRECRWRRRRRRRLCCWLY